MQLNRRVRLAGVTISGAALGLLPVAGVAAAHDSDSSSPSLHGRVVSVGSGNFVLRVNGGTQTVDTTGSTSYAELGSSTTLPGVLDGEWVAVTLDPSASAPTATSVTVFPERAGGTVTSMSGSTVTLASRYGSRTVLVSPSTAYVEKNASPTGVSTGEVVVVSGLPDSTTPATLDAQRVFIVSPPAPAPPSQPQPVTGGTPTNGAPTAAAVHPPVQTSKPLPSSEGPPASQPQQQPSSSAPGQGGPGVARYNGSPGIAQRGGPAGGSQGWSHGGNSGGSFGGGSGGVGH
jgi:hypothetical protein